MRKLLTASFEEIKEGKTADVYFHRTLEIIRKKGIDKRVRAEFIAKKLPRNYTWAIFAGLWEVLNLLEGLPINVRGFLEGEVFFPYEPVLEIEGNYSDFCVLESAILGLICQASGVATTAARCKKAAGEKPVFSFGSRRMHPAIAPMVDRNAYIGGCDGVSSVLGAEFIGMEPVGTMPHALILLVGDTVTATKYFDEVVDKAIKRVSLIDTFNDEKFEAVRVAEALGDKLFAVRLDTPSTRRGNFKKLLEEVRWELDIRGFKNVKIFASGGLNDQTVMELKDVVDAFGVGTFISNAPTVDFAMDIVEIEGKPIAKRGKHSGSKKVFRCESCLKGLVVPLGESDPERCPFCEGNLKRVDTTLIENGRVVVERENAEKVRDRVIKYLEKLEL